MASISSIVGLSSTPSAPSSGRGTGHRGPTRGVTEMRLGDGQQWNVSLTKELIFKDLQYFNGKSLDDVIAFIPVSVDSSHWQTMCEKWTNANEQLELFKMDGNKTWVDEESRRLYVRDYDPVDGSFLRRQCREPHLSDIPRRHSWEKTDLVMLAMQVVERH
ncbi:hypothetical protein Taro_041192 [Colocasia esculenta]|uniref:Uncharacterized protein n=1 Tax=Colocasia esculenta TaxID=4460 RepID=A0A843WKV1_COLES|nr:hypothetical protein [Colocasia esculenta]